MNDVRTSLNEVGDMAYVLSFAEFAKTCEQRIV